MRQCSELKNKKACVSFESQHDNINSIKFRSEIKFKVLVPCLCTLPTLPVFHTGRKYANKYK